MFPLNDFNIVYCALATLTAAVGYNVSQRQRNSSVQRQSENEKRRFHHTCRRDSSPSVFSACGSTVDSEMSELPLSDCPTPSDNASDSAESGTSKRKNRDDDLQDPLEQVSGVCDESGSSTPPTKRCKVDVGEGQHDGLMTKAEDVEITAASRRVDSPSVQQQASEAMPYTAVTPVNEEGRQCLPVPTAPIFPTPLLPILPVKPSSAFTSFAGSSSAFALAPSGAPSTTSKPVWCTPSTSQDIIISDSSSPHVQIRQHDVQTGIGHLPSVNSEHVETAVETGEIVSRNNSGKIECPLAAPTYSKSTHTIVTGEEDEQVRAELKGAKVFIKRGEKEFSDGILGHVKLLSHRDTGDERLLFRREPVWKVTMSVRLRPTVRCSFDENEGVLRIALKESEEREGVPAEKQKQHVVVYAMKRGKASRDDFASFARAVTASSWLVGSSHTEAAVV